MTIEELKNILNKEAKKARGAYARGVAGYALEIAENIGDQYKTTAEQLKHLEQFNRKELEGLALNGADSWSQYSWGGCSLCYNYDILENLFCPSMVKKYENADSVRGVHLLDYQATALARAFSHVFRLVKAGA